MITFLELLYIKNLHKGKDDIKTLASKIGINQSMLYDIEAGRRNLTKDIFNKITNYYNVTYDDRQSVYDEAYNLTLELFSYLISFEKPRLFERYDEMHDRIEMYQHSKAFIFYDLIQAIRNKENNDKHRKQYLLRCEDYIDVYDNNVIFVYCNLWAFVIDLPYNYKTLEDIVIKSYQRYSLVGVNDDILAMLYYQIGRIYESKHDNFEAINFYNKSIEVFKNCNNIQRIIQAKISIAGCYFDLRDYDKAEVEYLKLYEVSCKHGFDRRITACSNNLAFLYFMKYDFDNCLKFIKISKDYGSKMSTINYYLAYIIYKTKDIFAARKEINGLLDNVNNVVSIHAIKLIKAFINENDDNVDYYFKLTIKDFDNMESKLDIQLMYEMVLDYYKDRNPQRVKELLPEYIKLIR